MSFKREGNESQKGIAEARTGTASLGLINMSAVKAMDESIHQF